MRINWATKRVLIDHSRFIIIIIIIIIIIVIIIIIIISIRGNKESKTKWNIYGSSFEGENCDPHMQICYEWMNWEISLQFPFCICVPVFRGDERDKLWF